MNPQFINLTLLKVPQDFFFFFFLLLLAISRIIQDILLDIYVDPALVLR
jgi:hypothetical protein